MVKLRQVSNHFTDVPDQQAQSGRLLHFVADFQLDLAVVDHAHLFLTDDGGQYRRLFEVLAQIPWTTGFTCLQLQVTTSHIEATGIAVNDVVGIRFGDVKAFLTDRYDKLHLVVVVGGLGRVGDGGTGFNQRAGIFQEVERLLGGFIHCHAHLGGVGQIVTANTENTVYREALFNAFDGRADNRLGWKQQGIGHAGYLLCWRLNALASATTVIICEVRIKKCRGIGAAALHRRS